MSEYDMIYICKECGDKYKTIPKAYFGDSGSHFGGGETMFPSCRNCNCGSFYLRSKKDDDLINKLSKKPSVTKILYEFIEMLKEHKVFFISFKQNKIKVSMYRLTTINRVINKMIEKYKDLE